MAKEFTVIWLQRGNPVVTRITLGRDEHPKGYSHDTWLAHALVTHWATTGESGTWNDAYLYIDDVGPGLAAVIPGHPDLIWGP